MPEEKKNNEKTLPTASQRLAALNEAKAKAMEAAQAAQLQLETAEKELLGEARKEQEEILKGLPALLNVESLQIVSALCTLMAKDGSLANARSSTISGDRKARTTLNLIQKLAVCVDRKAGVTAEEVAKKYNVSPGTVFNIVTKEKELIAEAKKENTPIPPALMAPAKLPAKAAVSGTGGK